MEMLLLVLAVFALLVWVAVSPDRLASTIRTRFQGAKSNAADALDDANARMDAAVAEDEVRLAKARAALVTIKADRVAAQNDVNRVKGRVAEMTTAAENAASVQNQPLVVAALERKRSAEEELIPLETQLARLQAAEQQVQRAVTAVEAHKAQLVKQKVEIRTRAKAAQTSLSVDQLLAGINLDGSDGNVNRAFELVREIEAKSGAMAEIASEVTERQDVERQLEQLSKPQTSIDDEAQALLAKYQSTPTPVG